MNINEYEAKSKLKFYHFILLGCLLGVILIVNSDYVNNKKAEYKLFSVVNHQGNVDYGHYFSYIQPLKSQNWFLFNDSQVKHVKEGLKSFPNAYALFYINTKNI